MCNFIKKKCLRLFCLFAALSYVDTRISCIKGLMLFLMCWYATHSGSNVILLFVDLPYNAVLPYVLILHAFSVECCLLMCWYAIHAGSNVVLLCVYVLYPCNLVCHGVLLFVVTSCIQCLCFLDITSILTERSYSTPQDLCKIHTGQCSPYSNTGTYYVREYVYHNVHRYFKSWLCFISWRYFYFTTSLSDIQSWMWPW